MATIIPGPMDSLPLLTMEKATGEGVIVVNRVSGSGQGGSKLKAKNDAMIRKLQERYHGIRIRAVFSGVEKSKLVLYTGGGGIDFDFDRRPVLLNAIVAASYHKLPLVFWFQDRFLRPISDAVWVALMFGIEVYVIEQPKSVSELWSSRIKRTGKAGRPREISPDQCMAILDELGCKIAYGKGRWKWENSIAVVAQRVGVSQDQVKSLLNSPVPGVSGFRWRDYHRPGELYRIGMSKMH